MYSTAMFMETTTKTYKWKLHLVRRPLVLSSSSLHLKYILYTVRLNHRHTTQSRKNTSVQVEARSVLSWQETQADFLGEKAQH